MRLHLENTMLKALTWMLLSLSSCIHASEIVSLDKGLTLAETGSSDLHTLLIVADNEGSVSALDISEITGVEGGIVKIFQVLGYEGIVNAAASAKQNDIKLYHYSTLLSPAGKGTHHIAVGFNYPEHADEIKQEHAPFVFLKTTKATRDSSLKVEPGVLLDYEVEICARPMQGIAESTAVDSTYFGLFLCGDFTDRAALLRGIDLDDMRSGQGFSYAKSKPGYFPTGPYLVIPKNKREFLDDIVFALSLNGAQKQSASAGKTFWSLTQTAQEVISADKTKRTTYTDRVTDWLPDNQITSDMTILNGTPEGVIMRPPTLGFKLVSGIGYALTGAFVKTDVRQYTVERYIKTLEKNKVFLQAGDSVQMKARYLGEMNLLIAPDEA